MELTKNQAVLDWIDQQVALTKPDQVIWIDGARPSWNSSGRKPAPPAKCTNSTRKNSWLLSPPVGPHRRGPGGEPDLHLLQKAGGCGPHQQLDGPQEMYAKLHKLYDGSMKGRTMYVIPYCMSVVGSPLPSTALSSPIPFMWS